MYIENIIFTISTINIQYNAAISNRSLCFKQNTFDNKTPLPKVGKNEFILNFNSICEKVILINLILIILLNNSINLNFNHKIE